MSERQRGFLSTLPSTDVRASPEDAPPTADRHGGSASGARRPGMNGPVGDLGALMSQGVTLVASSVVVPSSQARSY